MAEEFPWLAAALAAPAAAALGSTLRLPSPEARRALLAVSAGASLLAALAAAAFSGAAHGAGASSFRSGWAAVFPALDDLSAPLLPFAAMIFLVVALAAPRAAIGPAKMRRVSAAAWIALATFAARDPVLLAILWGFSLVPPWHHLRASGDGGRAARIFARYMVPCAAAFAAGALLLKAGAPAWGSVFLAGAVLARMGIAPFHSWMPEMFEHAPLSAATLFAAPHIGAYAAARLLVPSAPAFILDLAAGAALITAVYGSGAALVQENPRRSFGFLSMSQSALILVGLDCDAAVGIVGGLVWWLASGLSLAGFCMTLWLLESRRGPMSLAEFHGGAERMPALAAGFLVLGLASVGFPGTLGFIGGELLVDGAVETFPHVGFAVVAAAGLNAVTVLRLYYFLFCGTREVSPLAHRLRVREQAALALLVGLLVGFGLYPRPLLESRARAAAEWARLPAAEAR